MKVNLGAITTKGKALFLAYDQGLEHGPSKDFNDLNVDPEYILDIAKKGKFNAVVFQKGIAEKYHSDIVRSGVPLLLKLNGKTNLYKGEAFAEQLCSVKEAVKLSAKAVGYTIYLGSKHEAEMMKTFEQIEMEAHAVGLPVVLWAYARGSGVKDDSSREIMAYAARVGLELGADIVKIKYGGKADDVSWAAKAAGRTKVVIAGGMKTSESDFLKSVGDVMKTGATGIAVGRNVWQAKDPIALAKKLRKIVFASHQKD